MSAILCWFANSMELETQSLARGLRRRDPELLDHLIEQYQFRLFRYLLYLTGRREVAEDLFQETWIRVLERGYQYNGKAKFETWLFAIARHLVIDMLRRRKSPADAPASLDDLGDPGEGKAGFEPPNRESAALIDLLAAAEEGEHVRSALACLPAAYREVLMLRFQEDLQLEEIAAVTSAPLSTVKSRLYRGLADLRQQLEKDHGR
jgi:RNA polymerase sigma-70 factor, ECF subfamily